MSSISDSRTRTIGPVSAVFVLSFAFFAFVALHRLVDDDEGYYALAGRSILDGRLPYRDFFLPQMPYAPLAYGVLQAVFGRSLVALRLFGAVCAAATGALTFVAARRIGGFRAGVVASALFATHTLAWEWATTVKTYPLGLLLFMATLVVITLPSPTRRTAIFAGALAGLAVGARALNTPIVFAVVAAYWSCGERMARSKQATSPRSGPESGTERRGVLLVAAALGFGVALLPVAVSALADVSAFLFDNIGYHALRSPGTGLVKDAAQKLDALRALLLVPRVHVRPESVGMQTTALLIAAVLGFRRVRAWHPEASSYVVAIAAVFVVSFLPSPTYTQYFALLVPPAAVLAACAVTEIERRWVAPAVVATYGAVAAPAFVDRILDTTRAERPAAMDDVGRALDGATSSTDTVAAHFPAYLVATHRNVLWLAENQFARVPSDRVSAEARRRYHLGTEADFRRALLAGEARALVLGFETVPETALALKNAGWSPASGANGLVGPVIWVRPKGGGE